MPIVAQLAKLLLILTKMQNKLQKIYEVKKAERLFKRHRLLDLKQQTKINNKIKEYELDKIK